MMTILDAEIKFKKNSLIFLSMCASGSIQKSHTSQSLGIPMAFSTKGAGSIIGTHRAILDNIAFSVSKKFYFHLINGENSVEALKIAKDEIISSLQDDQLEEYLSIVSYHHIGIPFHFRP